MAQRGKHHKDEVLILALACGATIEAAARQAGVSESTAYRRREDPTFRRRLQALRSDMAQRTTGMLTAAGMESVKTLLELQKPNVPPAARLGAARTVLELGMKMREFNELEERIAALEEQLAASQNRA
jgi:tRNA A37 N6-isopentenylltransferase MiaA